MRHILSTLWTIVLLIVSMALPSAAWADGSHRLTVMAKPAMAGSFNTSTADLEAGQSVQLVAYANANFTFLRWTDEQGSVLSQQMDFTYVMLDRDVKLTAEYEYNPANPANPARNYWNKLLGEVIVDDFTTGSLQNAVKNVIGDSKAAEVMMITVAGVMNSNDLGIINTYSACTLLDLSRVTGVTEVPSYAFDYTKLESVYLPATIEKIGYRAFYECKQLSSLKVYAMTPPTLENQVFTNVPEGLVVYVPAAAISQYQEADGWKDFTILPIQEDIRSISVSLPEETNAADYAKMWLELTNTKSGQRMHYVITDRQTYTFANIIRNTSWNVTIRNERGDVFGQIDNVEVKDEDVSVTFASLSKPQMVVLSVLTPDGQDVTSQTQVTWTDAQGSYLAQSASLTGLPTGYQTTYRVVLSQELAMVYNTPQPEDYVLTDGDNRITCQLNAIPQVKISGKVKDASTGLPLTGAVVSASQTFGAKYSKTLNAKTNGNGVFTLDIANVPTSIAFAASDYVSQTRSFSDNELHELNELEDVLLKSITGVTISLAFTYTTCEGETQNWYSDYQNVSYELFNVTKNKAISQYNVQYPQIVLMEEVDDGDVLQLTATSRTTNYTNSTNVGAFMPVTATATIAEQKAQATFDIVELGKIQASFASTGNASVVGSLYDAAGKLLKTYNYSEASLTISDLADGEYTLVSMGSSRLFNTIYDLLQLPQTGLVEGTDYVQNSVEVKSGEVSTISISEVPALDESKLYYTGENTSFTVNKPSIVAGNYLTLTGRIDFKPAYATSVSNVQMIVDIPESCQFVENSVMVGNSTSSYTLNGNRITIPMARYTDRVRFCIIPTLGGEYAPSAFVQFDLDGETVTQPIGSANYTAKDLSISVPSTVAKTAIPVSGTAIGKSDVEIYDNGVLIGQTTSLANGTWATTCELNEPYNLSTHSIYARVTTKARLELQSETVECLYDKNAIEVKTVTMINTAHTAANLQLHDYVTVFDFQNPEKPIPAYWYWPSYPDFTFLVDFTNNDTTIISNVVLNVLTTSNDIRKLYPRYDTKCNAYVAHDKFFSGSLPKNVCVTFNSNTVIEADTIQLDAGWNQYYNDLTTFNEENDTDIALLDSLISELNSDTPSEEEIRRIVTIIYSRRQNVDSGNDNDISPFNGDENIDDIERNVSEYDSPDLEELFRNLPNFAQSYKGTVEPMSVEGVETPRITFDFTSGAEKFHNGVGSEQTNAIYIPSNTWNISPTDNENGQMQVKLVNKDGDVIAIDFSANSMHWASSSEEYLEQGGYLAGLGSYYAKQIKDSSTYVSAVGIALSAYETLLMQSCNYYMDVLKATMKLEVNPRVMELRQYVAGCLMNNKRAMSNIGAWGRLVNVANSFISAHTTVNDGYKAWSAYNDWDDIMEQIGRLCDQSVSRAILEKVEKHKKWIGRRKIIKTAGSTVLTYGAVFSAFAAAGTFGTSLPFAFMCTGGNIAMSVWEHNYDKTNAKNIAEIISEVNTNSKCKPFGTDNLKWPGFPDVQNVMDPSGYVYEGVASNRIEGVTATAYYKEMVEDMYGDLHENIVKWDAAEYAQENPLFTDEAGMYAWDVPQGLWQVKFEKEGYETTYSEWLPVPPPQLDVNIAMKQNRQPEVKAARAYEDAVEVEFDKYMMPELLTTENIMVIAPSNSPEGGEKAVEGTIELLNEEVSYEGEAETFASKIRFNAVEPFDATEVKLIVNNRVKSYAGIRMQDNYEQTFSIEQEIKQIVSDSLKKVAYGESSTLIVQVLPASASKDKVLTVKTSSPMILNVANEQVTIGDDGKAEIEISGELPGMAALTFTVEGCDLSATTLVHIKTTTACKKPLASIASGTLIGADNWIYLTCDTEDATIYYTFDGSCPCDETKRIKYTGPFALPSGEVTVNAIAVKDGMDDSDIATFTYSVSTPSMQLSLKKGWNWVSHPFEDEVSLISLIGSDGSRVQSQQEEIINDPQYGWTGSLQGIEGGQGYKVQMTSNSTVTLNGTNYQWATQLPLQAGWNWTGYTCSFAASLSHALKNTKAEEGDVIFSQNSFSTFANGKWVGTLETIDPGFGYMYKSMTTKSLVYNATLEKPTSCRQATEVMTVQRKAGEWSMVDMHNYPSQMALIGMLYKDGQPIAPHTVGAFCGDECRGISSTVGQLVFLSICGDTGELITLRMLDDDGTEYGVELSMEFDADIHGSVNQPLRLDVLTEGITAIIDAGLGITVELVNGSFVINGVEGGCVCIYDLQGREIAKCYPSNRRTTIRVPQAEAYIVNICDSKGQSLTRKVILRH